MTNSTIMHKQGHFSSSLGYCIGEGQKPTHLNELSQSVLERSLGFVYMCQKKQERNAYLTGLIGVHQNTSQQQDEISCQDS